jgi:hypothetical protein
MIVLNAPPTASLASVHTKLDTIDTVVDGNATKLTTIEGKVDTVDTVVDGNATKLTTIDGKVDTVDTVVDGNATKLTTIEGKVDTVDTVVDLIKPETDKIQATLTAAQNASFIGTMTAGTLTASGTMAGLTTDYATILSVSGKGVLCYFTSNQESGGASVLLKMTIDSTQEFADVNTGGASVIGYGKMSMIPFSTSLLIEAKASASKNTYFQWAVVTE